MRAITVHRLCLQFYANQNTRGSDLQEALHVVDLINDLLQRQNLGVSAQLIATRDEIEVESSNETDS